MLTLFLDDRRGKGLSVNTLSFYQGYLAKFFGRVAKPIVAVRKEDVTGFLNSLTCSAGGKHAYFRAIRAFYKWALEEGHVSEGLRISPPKVPKPLRYAVNVADIARLLGAAEGTRDKLIVLLLADTGLRRAELCSIEWADVDAERDTIRVWGKGAKQRVVRYGPQTKGLIEPWRQESGDTAGGSLLGLKPTGLQDVLKRLEARTGIKCNAHAFRRTFACESVRNGLNVFYLQSLLGHSSLTMTRIYAEQVNSEDAIKAYKPIVT
ncbi:MAG: tyrosine-type recombinase/integrase [Chloroflexi bacterium]|nr:tyrosine-type recombinase/integrase [Chloroflexota bacterium]